MEKFETHLGKFIYLPFLENNNVGNQIKNFLKEFDEQELDKFINLVNDKIGTNEQIIMTKENNGIKYEIEYDCLQNLIDLIITDFVECKVLRLTSMLQLKGTLTTKTELFLPSKLKVKSAKLYDQPVAYLILSKSGEMYEDYNFTNHNSETVATIFNPNFSNVLTCAVTENGKFVKNKYTVFEGDCCLNDNFRLVQATYLNEEYFNNAEMFKQDFDEERYVNRDLILLDEDSLIYEESVMFKNVEKGIYQVIKRDSIGESAYFGDIVDLDECYVRKYDPNDKGTYNFNNNNSKEVKISKLQLHKILNNDIDIKNIINKNLNNNKE